MKLNKNILIPIVLMQFVAFWPVWEWFYTGFTDPAGDIRGVLPLITALFFLINIKPVICFDQKRLYLPAGLCLFYCIVFHISPPSIRAAIAICVISSTASILTINRNIDIGLSGLFLLSLPVISSLQFYFGYPLRVASGIIAVLLLQLSGFPVILDGTLLNMNGILVSIDAPCSGIKMMWTGLYLAMTLSCLYRLSPVNTVGMALLALPVVIFGNTIRTTGLFFTETGIIELPEWAHSAIGMITFVLISLAILFIATRFKKGASCEVSGSL